MLKKIKKFKKGFAGLSKEKTKPSIWDRIKGRDIEERKIIQAPEETEKEPGLGERLKKSFSEGWKDVRETETPSPFRLELPEQIKKTKSYLLANENKIKSGTNDTWLGIIERDEMGKALGRDFSSLTDVPKDIMNKFHKSLTTPRETEYRPPFSTNTRKLNLSLGEDLSINLLSRLVEAPPKAVMVGSAEVGEMVSAGIQADDWGGFVDILADKNIETKTPIDMRRLGFSEKTYRTAARETLDLIDSGWDPFTAGLYTASARTLDVAFGAKITQSMAKLTNKALVGQGEGIKTVQYWKDLGMPKNKADLSKKYKQMLHQFHPDKASGNEAMMKSINKAYQQLQKKFPNKADFVQYETWRNLTPFTRGTVVTQIKKDGPPTIVGPDGKLKVQRRAWNEIWDDVASFPKRFSKPDNIPTRLYAHELANAENLLKLPGYRPIPGQGPQLGLSIQKWEKIGGTKGKVAKTLADRYGKQKANDIIRYKGEGLMSDVSMFGLDQALGKVILSDVPNVAHSSISPFYNKTREAIKSEELTPIFPKEKATVSELSPNLYKLNNKSKVMQIHNKIKQGRGRLMTIVDSKQKQAATKKIDKLRKQEVEEARKAGIAIIKDSEGRDVPAIRESGFYASEEFMNFPIRDVGGVSESLNNAALMQDMSFNERGGIFGPTQRHTYYPTKEAMAAKEQSKIEFSGGFLKTIKDNNIKLSKSNMKKLREAQLIAKSDDWIDMSLSGLKDKYPKLSNYSDEMLRVAQHSQKGMRKLWETANKIRAEMGKDPIGKIENYVTEMHRVDELNSKIMQGGLYEYTDTPSYIVPDYNKNPFTKKRLNKIPEKDKEKNFAVLYEKYIHSMLDEIYTSPVIEQIKANNKVLEFLGKGNAKKYWETVINNNLLKRPSGLDEYLGIREGTARKVGLEKIIDARIKASLAGNILWNVSTMPLSYFTLTTKETGVLNSMVKGPLNYMFNKDLAKEISKDHTMLLKAKKAHSASYQGGLDAYDQAIYKSPIKKTTDLLSVLAHSIEKHLTGMSYAAGKLRGKDLGYTGDDLISYASIQAEQTQSLYNRQLRPPILNNTTVRSGFPFNTFVIENYKHLEQIFGKGKMPNDARMRLGKALSWMAGIYLGNQYFKAIRGYSFSSPGDFVPFVGGGVDMVFDEMFGTDFSYKRRDSIALVQDAIKLGRALKEIGEGYQEVTSHDYGSFQDLARGVAEYAADGNLSKFRSQFVYWASGLSGMGGGQQANRMVDFIQDAQQGYTEDMYGREWFPVELKDIPFGILFGSYSTPSAKEAKEEDELQERAIEEAQSRKDKIHTEAQRIADEWLAGTRQEAETKMSELRQYDPNMARLVEEKLAASEEEDLTRLESRFSALSIRDGSRATAIYEHYKELSKEKRLKGLNNLMEKGVITPMVYEQLNKQYGWK